MALIVGGTLAFLYLADPWRWVVIAALAGLEAFEVMLWLSLRNRPATTGPESMVGRTGVLTASGRVRLGGTTYAAKVLGGAPGEPARVEAVDGLTAGERVRVEAVDGLTLVVRRAPDEDRGTS